MDVGRGLVALVALLAACGDDGAAAVDPATSGPSSAPADASDPTPASGDSSSAARDPDGAPGDASESSTSAPASSSSSTGMSVPDEPSDPPDVALFVDVTDAAGVSYVQGVLQSSPNCLIDQIGAGQFGFCTPERMIAGAAVGDADGDGLDDLFVTRTAATDILFHNEGDGTFTDVTAESGIDVIAHSSGASFADVDNDGDLDLYVSSIASYRYHLWINDGTGTFTEEALVRGAALDSSEVHVGTSIGVGDYDLDGYVDLYVGEWRTIAGLGNVPSHSRLLHNLGDTAPGHFEDVTDAAGVNVDHVWIEAALDLAGTYSFSPGFADLDGDGWPELTMASDFATSRLFWNQGDGTFVDGTLAAGAGTDQNGMGSALGDYDNDGDLDWFVTSITQDDDAGENRFYRNIGPRLFDSTEALLAVGDSGWGWGTLFFDANNDGDLDLVAANGYYYTAHLEETMKLWSNEGVGPFEDVSAAAGMVSTSQHRGLLTFDYDADGDLDLFVTVNCGEPELLQNVDGNQGDWLRVRAVGTTSNREGIGARVTLRAHDDGPTQLREIGAAGHYMGQSERVAHFGIAIGAGPLAEVRVRWPASGQEQVFTDVDRNTELVVEEP
jgi:hypothetical protein